MVANTPAVAGRNGRRTVGRSVLLSRVSSNTMVVVGGTIVLVLVLLALLGPILLQTSPLAVDPGNRLLPPSKEHWFGTDNLGRDLFARVLHGARISIGVGFAVAVITSVLGLGIGLYASYNKVLDGILMRIADGLMAFPAILLAIAIMAVLGPRTQNIIIALVFVFTPYVARVVRSSALVVKELTFVESLRAQGASSARILWLNITPNLISPLIVQASFIFADAIIVEAALSFLGAGVPAPSPSWGNVLFDGRTFIYNAWWMTVFPGIAIMLAVLGVNLLGDGLRDLLDPHYNRARKRG